MKSRRAFTLVELLVVIGIIALLVGILLPALSAARRQANALKCATALREIGNAFQMYAMEERGYFPVAKAGNVSTYHLTTPTRPPIDSNVIQYWPNFLAKYVSRAKLGNSGTNANDQTLAQKTVFWGCPAYDGYGTAATASGVATVQTGYGMNAFPEFSATFPNVGAPPNGLPSETSVGPDGTAYTIARAAVVDTTTAFNWGFITSGKWYKQKNWTKPAERALVADARFWLLEVQAGPLNGVIPGQSVYQNSNTYATPTDDGQTLYDFYRHGKYPGISQAGFDGRYAANGGKIAFNVLYADGHVATLIQREDGYRAGRMRFPG